MGKSVQIRVPAAASLTVFALAGIIMFSCVKDVGRPAPQPPPPPPPPPGQADKCDSITYSKHIGPLFTSSCIACHNPNLISGGQVLTTYDQVKAIGANGKLKGVTLDGIPRWMPLNSELPEHQKELIRCWLKNGMKQ
jgi:hypothetical protein